MRNTNRRNTNVAELKRGPKGSIGILLHFDDVDVIFNTSHKERNLILKILNGSYCLDFGENIRFESSGFKLMRPYRLINIYEHGLELVLNRAMDGSLAMKIINPLDSNNVMLMRIVA